MAGLSLEERFNELVKIVQSLPKDGDIKISNDNKLKFYAYFKQATVGPVNTTQPYFYQVVERAKWDSWNSVKDLTKDEAMQAYLDEMKEAVKDSPYSEHDTHKRILELIYA